LGITAGEGMKFGPGVWQDEIEGGAWVFGWVYNKR